MTDRQNPTYPMFDQYSFIGVCSEAREAWIGLKQAYQLLATIEDNLIERYPELSEPDTDMNDLYDLISRCRERLYHMNSKLNIEIGELEDQLESLNYEFKIQRNYIEELEMSE